MWQDITEKNKENFNNLANHPLQSFEWGEFREKTGIKVIRKGFFERNKLTQILQLTIHPIPHTSFTIGYLPKGILPNKILIEQLRKIGKENNCIFIQLEPNIKAVSNFKFQISNLGLCPAVRPLFTKYSFQLDITKSEEELLRNMSQKTRYNIRVAQKHGVVVRKEKSQNAFHAYLQLTEETTRRQGFYAHTKKYHTLMWETLQSKNKSVDLQKLTAHLFVAYIGKQPLTTWIVFTFHNMLYYPYGASSSQHRETMSSNLMMWEIIRFGKKLQLETFDMWGSLGPEPNPKDPWYGFHKFKMGYNPTLVEFIGSYDVVINPLLYKGYKMIDKLRWILLRFLK